MINLLLVLIIVGFVIYVAMQIPMPQIFRTIIIGIVGICLLIWLLQVLGIDTGFRLRL